LRLAARTARTNFFFVLALLNQLSRLLALPAAVHRLLHMVYLLSHWFLTLLEHLIRWQRQALALADIRPPGSECANPY